MKNNTQKINKYLADTKITKGLYLTTDPEKVKTNCKYFKLKKPIKCLSVAKKDKIAIITIRTSKNKFIQLNVKWTFNIKELDKINNEFIGYDVRLMIQDAYQLTQLKTNNEWVIELTNECLT